MIISIYVWWFAPLNSRCGYHDYSPGYKCSHNFLEKIIWCFTATLCPSFDLLSVGHFLRRIDSRHMIPLWIKLILKWIRFQKRIIQLLVQVVQIFEKKFFFISIKQIRWIWKWNSSLFVGIWNNLRITNRSIQPEFHSRR